MEKVFVRSERLEEFMSEKGFSDVSMAELMGMDRTTIFKAKNGEPVGGKFIANLLRVANGRNFDDLFFRA